jgi:hypothetical protein
MQEKEKEQDPEQEVFETPREYVERNVPKAGNIEELVASIREDGFTKAADIPLTTGK